MTSGSTGTIIRISRRESPTAANINAWGAVGERENWHPTVPTPHTPPGRTTWSGGSLWLIHQTTETALSPPPRPPPLRKTMATTCGQIGLPRPWPFFCGLCCLWLRLRTNLSDRLPQRTTCTAPQTSRPAAHEKDPWFRLPQKKREKGVPHSTIETRDSLNFRALHPLFLSFVC